MGATGILVFLPVMDRDRDTVTFIPFLILLRPGIDARDCDMLQRLGRDLPGLGSGAPP